ncbi:DUF1048 domain-containing protein [Raoultibacter phocaeensis]|uniref:DUF1048 domain-containing protein n=1 Tax=Raoultibacter phocaeensis TaxID=2479841 RepID=UPI00111955C3|nr:DUF1048 domain-containing protein [Raoultibacter phocaeensis]
MADPVAYFKRVAQEKREYREAMERVRALPEEYRFVYDKIQHYLWNHVAGDGMDMTVVLTDLVDLFEVGAADGKDVLEVTGEDVAAFCDELLKSTKTYQSTKQDALNRSIKKKLG